MRNQRKWRKEVKKLQRKRRRQKAARERDKILEEEETARLNDPAYQQMLRSQEKLEEILRLAEERAREEEEEMWLRRELLAQKHFRLEQQRRAAEEAEQEKLRVKQQQELEAIEEAKRKQREEKERQTQERAEEFERTMRLMEEYLSNAALETPAELRRCVESRPGEQMCTFFERTNCCKFGVTCQFNHKRPLLSSIILVRNFFSHPLMERHKNSEYDGADAALELDETDLRGAYDDFFWDVVPEMERFGKLLNFRTIRNMHPHLGGNVFVEFVHERSALKAFINLQGRFYATKRLNVEFSNIKSWRGAVCDISGFVLQGFSVQRKCPKGLNCNYLHLFRNPENKYNTLLEFTKKSTDSRRHTPSGNAPTPLLSWDDDRAGNPNDQRKPRNWRWSESPEVELRSHRTGDSQCRGPQREHERGRTTDNKVDRNHGSSKRYTNSPSSHSKGSPRRQKTRRSPLGPTPQQSERKSCRSPRTSRAKKRKS